MAQSKQFAVVIHDTNTLKPQIVGPYSTEVAAHADARAWFTTYGDDGDEYELEVLPLVTQPNFGEGPVSSLVAEDAQGNAQRLYDFYCSVETGSGGDRDRILTDTVIDLVLLYSGQHLVHDYDAEEVDPLLLDTLLTPEQLAAVVAALSLIPSTK